MLLISILKPISQRPIIPGYVCRLLWFIWLFINIWSTNPQTPGHCFKGRKFMCSARPPAIRRQQLTGLPTSLIPRRLIGEIDDNTHKIKDKWHSLRPTRKRPIAYVFSYFRPQSRIAAVPAGLACLSRDLGVICTLQRAACRV